MPKKYYWILAAVVSVLASLFYLSPSTEAEMVTVGKGTIQHAIVDTGYVQAADNYDLYAQQGGRVNNIPVKVGDNIKKGQVIMVLENLDLSMSSEQLRISLNQARSAAASAEAAINGLKIDLRDAETKYARVKELYAAGAVSKAELDEAGSLVEKYQTNSQDQSNNLKIAQSQVDTYIKLIAQSEQKEAQLEVKSPINGTVMELPVKQEQAVAYGSLLVRVAQAADLEIKADLLSDDLGEVKLGQKVQVTAPVMGEKVLNGEIIKIYPQAEEKQSALGVIQRRVPVIIALESTDILKPGYETRVNIITAKEEDVVLIPREAVRSTADGKKEVMLVDKGRVVFRSVKTGLLDSKNIEITEGLKAGDQIIKDASVTLKEDTRVKAKK